MPEIKTFWDFATSATFQWIALLVGLLGTAFGIISWLDGKRKEREYKFLFDAADKNIDKNVTEEQIKAGKSEAAQVSQQIEQLRKRIDTEIPLEAKRTVLRDRLDANILNLQATLSSTLDLKNQLTALGAPSDLPRELIEAVQAEILPEYINNSRRESLKTYLIIVMAMSALVSAVLPEGLSLAIQMPLLVVGISILSQLVKEYASKLTQTADPFAMNVIASGLYAGALTSGVFAFVIERERLPDQRWNAMQPQEGIAIVAITFSIMLVALLVWLFKTKRGWAWRILCAFIAIIVVGIGLFSSLLLSNVRDLGQFAGAYVFALLSVIMLSAALYLQMRKRLNARSHEVPKKG